MYIDKFHFSPFRIDDNILSVWNGKIIIKEGKIFMDEKEINPEEFYDDFVRYGQGRWFTADFIEAYANNKKAIPLSLDAFAVYCDFKFSFLSGGLA
jgi:hypothetical protein